MIAGGYEVSLRPSMRAPSTSTLAAQRTHSLAFSGESTAPRSHASPGRAYVNIRGATISFRSERAFCSSPHIIGPCPTPREVVIPLPIQSLCTYSAWGALPAPPVCACMSTSPGKMYMPDTSISRVAPSGRRLSLIGAIGKPTARISTIRSFSTTMSTGPRGGPPAPSM